MDEELFISSLDDDEMDSLIESLEEYYEKEELKDEQRK